MNKCLARERTAEKILESNSFTHLLFSGLFKSFTDLKEQKTDKKTVFPIQEVTAMSLRKCRDSFSTVIHKPEPTRPKLLLTQTELHKTLKPPSTVTS